MVIVLNIRFIIDLSISLKMHHNKIRSGFIYDLLTFSSSFLKKIIKDRKKLAFFILSGIIILFLIKSFEKFFFTLLLTGIGAASLVHSRYFKYSYYVGFELCTMATVITALAYGPAFGVFTGFFSIFGGFVLSGHFKPTYFVSVLAMPLIGILAPLFSHLPLLYLGLLMAIIYDAIILPLYVLFGSRVVSSVVFFVTHMLFNYWVFTSVAPIILGLLS